MAMAAKTNGMKSNSMPTVFHAPNPRAVYPLMIRNGVAATANARYGNLFGCLMWSNAGISGAAARPFP